MMFSPTKPKIRFRRLSEGAVDVSGEPAVSVLSFYRSERARRICLRIRISETLHHWPNVHINKVVGSHEEHTVDDGLFNQGCARRNAQVNTGNEDHEQKRLEEEIDPHLYLWTRILRKGVGGMSRGNAVASFGRLISVRARRAIIPEALTAVPIEIHDYRRHNREQDGVDEEDSRLGSARRNTSQNARHESNKEDGGQNTADELHLLFDARSFIGAR